MTRKKTGLPSPSRRAATSKQTALRPKKAAAPVRKPSDACEVIVAGASGEILTGEAALRWLARSTSAATPAAAHSVIPDGVRAWLERRGDAGESSVLLHELDQRLVVTLCQCRASPCFLLVQERGLSADIPVVDLKIFGLSPRQAEVLHRGLRRQNQSENRHHPRRHHPHREPPHGAHPPQAPRRQPPASRAGGDAAAPVKARWMTLAVLPIVPRASIV